MLYIKSKHIEISFPCRYIWPADSTKSSPDVQMIFFPNPSLLSVSFIWLSFMTHRWISVRAVGEALQVYGSGAAEVITGGLADGAGELGAADATDAFRFQGDGACNLRVGPEFSTVPCGRVGGDNKGVVLLIPGIEA